MPGEAGRTSALSPYKIMKFRELSLHHQFLIAKCFCIDFVLDLDDIVSPEHLNYLVDFEKSFGYYIQEKYILIHYFRKTIKAEPINNGVPLNLYKKRLSAEPLFDNSIIFE
jgi:hypothetical protein